MSEPLNHPFTISHCGFCDWGRVGIDLGWIDQQEGPYGRMRAILGSISGTQSPTAFMSVAWQFDGDFCALQSHNPDVLQNFIQCFYNSPVKLFNGAKDKFNIPGHFTGLQDPCP